MMGIIGKNRDKCAIGESPLCDIGVKDRVKGNWRGSWSGVGTGGGGGGRGKGGQGGLGGGPLSRANRPPSFSSSINNNPFKIRRQMTRSRSPPKVQDNTLSAQSGGENARPSTGEVRAEGVVGNDWARLSNPLLGSFRANNGRIDSYRSKYLHRISNPPGTEHSDRARVQSLLTSGGCHRNSEFYVSLSENTARVVGIAAFSLFSGSVLLSENIDNCLYETTLSFLVSIHPKVILLRRSPSILYEKIQNTFPEAKIEIMDSGMFNEAKGMEIYARLNGPSSSSFSLYSPNYVSLSSLHCLYTYFMEGEDFFIDPSKLTIQQYQLKDYLLLSTDTAKSMELMWNNTAPTASTPQDRGCKDKGGLYKSFHPITYGGGNPILTIERLLRASLLQPSICPQAIQSKQEIVNILIEHIDIQNSLASRNILI